MTITTAIEAITPAKAREYLDTIQRQRKVNKEHITKLARSMQSGHWKMTGEAIQFDVDGHLINGQHRMYAIIQSNTIQEFMVVRGLPTSAYEVMDQGRARTRGETLSTTGMRNYNAAAAAAGILVRLKFGLQIDRVQIDNAEVMDFARDNFEALEWAGIQAKRCRLLPGSTYGAALFLAYHAHRQNAQEFSDMMATGAGLGPRSPVLALRKKAQANNSSARKLDLNRTSNLLPIIIRAFDAFVSDEELSVIRATDGNYYPKNLNPDTLWEDK